MRTQEQIRERLEQLKVHKLQEEQKCRDAAPTNDDEVQNLSCTIRDRHKINTDSDELRHVNTIITTLEWVLQSQLEPINQSNY